MDLWGWRVERGAHLEKEDHGSLDMVQAGQSRSRAEWEVLEEKRVKEEEQKNTILPKNNLKFTVDQSLFVASCVF